MSYGASNLDPPTLVSYPRVLTLSVLIIHVLYGILMSSRNSYEMLEFQPSGCLLFICMYPSVCTMGLSISPFRAEKRRDESEWFICFRLEKRLMIALSRGWMNGKLTNWIWALRELGIHCPIQLHRDFTNEKAWETESLREDSRA